jgi:hypothetical protein
LGPVFGTSAGTVGADAFEGMELAERVTDKDGVTPAAEIVGRLGDSLGDGLLELVQAAAEHRVTNVANSANNRMTTSCRTQQGSA